MNSGTSRISSVARESNSDVLGRYMFRTDMDTIFATTVAESCPGWCLNQWRSWTSNRVGPYFSYLQWVHCSFKNIFVVYVDSVKHDY